MPEIEWMLRWEKDEEPKEEKREIANMDISDFTTLLAEIEHR